MKKNLLGIIIILFISELSLGQTSFSNGAEYFTFRHGLQLGTQSFDSYFKESVRLDSIVKGDEYYTILRNNEDSRSWKDLDTLSYKLLVTERKVFYSGNFYSDTNLITTSVKDVLFYDFSLKAGDTLFSIEPQSQNLQAYTCIIDSVKTITYQDGKPRVTQFVRGYSEATPNRPSGYFRFIEGVGSSKGLMYHNIIGYPPDLSLMSICKNDSLSYLDSSFYRWIPGDYCDEEHIKKLMVSVQDANKNHLKVYPNPTSSTLFFSEDILGMYKILNGIGETVKVGDASKPVDISSLPPQLYFIQVFTEEEIATTKFIKKN